MRLSGTLPHSVLFCCDHNAVRSPIAEALMRGGECRITQGHVQSLRTNGRHDMGGLADQYHAIPCELPGGESFHGE